MYKGSLVSVKEVFENNVIFTTESLFITTGARCIGELLQVNTVLHSLWMGFNKINDYGTSLIAGTLCKSRISVLSLWNCGITVTGAKELATGLSVNQSIKILYIGGNPITVEGARLVLQSAVNNGVCEVVYVSNDHKTDSEVQKMSDILETRQKV